MKQLLLLLHVTILIGLLAVSAVARPCKTLFISSFSFTATTTSNPNPNPNPNHHPSSSRFFAIVTEIRSQEDRKAPRFINILENDIILPHHIANNDGNDYFKAEDEEDREGSMFPFGLFRYDVSSFRDRTKDILSVVVALLFGVGCGALTAATMYLIWSLFFPRYDYYYDDDDDDDAESGGDSDAENSDVFSPKKYGYVKIPEVDSKPAAKEAV